MCRFWVNQHCVSINKILGTEFVTVKVSWNLNLMQSISTRRNLQLSRYVRAFKSNGMSGTKHSKTSRFQKYIEYKTNKQSTKYWY